MKKFHLLYSDFPSIVFLIVFAGIFYFQYFAFGKVPIPADTIVGLYHPWRDALQSAYPNGYPYKNPLITDPVRQQYVWRNFAIQELSKGRIPSWNPFSFSGTPLIANFQSAVFYPLNIIFVFVNFVTGWCFLLIGQNLLASIFMYWYLRNINLNKLSCLVGALVYGYSGYMIGWLTWNTIGHTLAWFPLLLLAKDHLLKKKSVFWAVILVFSDACSLLSGHLQTYLYLIVLSTVYLFIRIYIQCKDKHPFINFLKYLIRQSYLFFITGTIVLILTSVQWIPTLRFMFESARLVDLGNWMKDGWFIPWQHLIQFLIPDYFGNPATGNYWGVWNYGEFIGYFGIFPFLMVLYASLFRRDKKTIFFGLFLFMSLIFATPNPISYLPYKFGIPFISSLQPTRLLSVVLLTSSVLTALGLDMWLKKTSFRKSFIILIIPCLIIMIAAIIPGHIGLSLPQSNLQIIQRNTIFPAALLFVSGLILLMRAVLKNGNVLGIFQFKNKGWFMVKIGLIAVIMVDLLRFGWKFTPFTSQDFIFPTTKLINYIENVPGVWRIISTDRRIMPSNFSVYYHLQDVSGYDPLYLLKYNKFVSSWSRNLPDISPSAFNRIVTPENYDHFLTDFLGVRYIFTYGSVQSQKLKLISVEGNTYLYENQKAFPRAFLVSSIIHTNGENDQIQQMYNYNEQLIKYAVSDENISIPDVPINIDEENADIVQYEPNRIRINTKTAMDRLLVVTDPYYETWHADIDGLTVPIHKVNFMFRGVVVPAGNHIVEFKNHLI